MERAAQNHGVEVTCILDEEGGYGYGMEQRNHPSDAWPQEAGKWLRNYGWTSTR